MPTYDYRCKACDHCFEIMQKMSDDPLTICPECQGEVKRLIGAGAGFLFKGSGFYITDYRSDNYKKGTAKDKAAPASKTKGKSKS
jgi:putative FmdB family regulatory protein